MPRSCASRRWVRPRASRSSLSRVARTSTLTPSSVEEPRQDVDNESSDHGTYGGLQHWIAVPGPPGLRVAPPGEDHHAPPQVEEGSRPRKREQERQHQEAELGPGPAWL